jgi:hypothetical protein
MASRLAIGRAYQNKQVPAAFLFMSLARRKISQENTPPLAPFSFRIAAHMRYRSSATEINYLSTRPDKGVFKLAFCTGSLLLLSLLLILNSILHSQPFHSTASLL